MAAAIRSRGMKPNFILSYHYEVQSGLIKASRKKPLSVILPRLDRWADDLKFGPERELKGIDREIADARRAATLAQALQEKLDAQKAIRALEAKRAKKRRELYEAQDAIDVQRNDLIGRLESQLQQRSQLESLFLLRWSVT